MLKVTVREASTATWYLFMKPWEVFERLASAFCHLLILAWLTI